MAISQWPKNFNEGGNVIYPKSNSSSEIDMRQRFFDLIDGTTTDPQRGHWVLLRRMATAQRCSCWNEVGEGDLKYSYDKRKYDEPNKDCTVCDGEGWLYSEELHNVRRRIVTPPAGAGGMERQTDFGIMSIPFIVYYFKYYVNPTADDRIIEVDNDTSGNPTRPFVRNETYNITLAEPFRDLNGRIEYWRCAAKKEELRHGGTQ